MPKHALTIVTMTKPYRKWAANEVAGFKPSLATWMIQNDLAVPYQAPVAPGGRAAKKPATR
ncbi:MAG: hypothetical protein AAGN66_16255 [Acidobacteriota bacterium]